ncbi:MAG: guanylate kinase [Clostridiales bacterium]|nr:guanylate kinase [Clostridiales bacterium]
MSNEGLLLVVSGPTGAGKDKVINALLKKHNEIYTQISLTTRPKKEDDIEGVYDFVSNKEFFKKVEQGAFLEWSEVYGNYYGTPKYPVRKALKNGKDVLLEVDIKGALQIKETEPGAILIFILPTSINELKENILKSNKDTPENLLRRFNSAYNGIQLISTYNYGIINNNVEQAVEKIENIIQAEKCRVDRINFDLNKNN